MCVLANVDLLEVAVLEVTVLEEEEEDEEEEEEEDEEVALAAAAEEDVSVLTWAFLISLSSTELNSGHSGLRHSHLRSINMETHSTSHIFRWRMSLYVTYAFEWHPGQHVRTPTT